MPLSFAPSATFSDRDLDDGAKPKKKAGGLRFAPSATFSDKGVADAEPERKSSGLLFGGVSQSCESGACAPLGRSLLFAPGGAPAVERTAAAPRDPVRRPQSAAHAQHARREGAGNEPSREPRQALDLGNGWSATHNSHKALLQVDDCGILERSC